MRRKVFLFLAAICLCAAAHPAAAQKFLPKSIEFQGDPEYSDAELLATAGLRKGVVLDHAAMQDYSKRLLATGIFATVAFKFDGEDLIFMLTPSTDLLPVQIENLPLTPGKELDQKIHDWVPLYHGKVPAEGGLADDVDAALQKILASEGLKVAVAELTVTDQNTQEVIAVSYSITDAPVKVVVTSVDGVSYQFQSEFQTIATEAAKKPFSTKNSAANLEQALKQFYSGHGYAAAKIVVTYSGNPRMESRTIIVPFAIQVEEGHR
jgi:outer membrane protein assembly factor BamA